MRRTRLNREALITIREDRGLSQRQLARKSGISEQYLCDLEHGRRQGYSADTRLKLATALDVRVTELSEVA